VICDSQVIGRYRSPGHEIHEIYACHSNQPTNHLPLIIAIVYPLYELQIRISTPGMSVQVTACEISSFRIANGGPFSPSGHCSVKLSSKIIGYMFFVTLIRITRTQSGRCEIKHQKPSPELIRAVVVQLKDQKSFRPCRLHIECLRGVLPGESEA
jgi:hypothetical protein